VSEPHLSGAAAPSEDQYERKFTLFTFLLAGAVIYHQSKLGDWEVFSLHAVVSLTAIWCLLRPSATDRLLLMLGAHLISVAVDMPVIVNHWLLLGILELGVFVALAVGWARGEPWVRNRAALYRALAPYVRLAVVLVYAFAALAKVNGGFLDPAISCGSEMLGDLVNRVPVGINTDLLDRPAIYFTIAIELALPIFLSIRSTRIPAVFAGGGFHLMLALAGHLPFSGFAFAFYALFCPDDLPERFDRVRAAMPALDVAFTRARDAGRSPLGFPVLAAAFLAVAAAITYGPDGVRSPVINGFLVLFVVYALALGGLMAMCVAQGRPFHYQPGWLRLASPVWALAPIVVIVNALTPYLGLKTQDTFTMYSNMQTEAGHWNHELVPQDVQVFPYQNDLVRIVDSSDEDLIEAAQNDREWVWWELRAWAADNPDEWVEYERDGEVVRADPAGDHPELGDDPNPVLQKLVLFRDVPTEDGNDCRINRNVGPAQGS
jgi:hypothetical protein